MKNKGIPFVFAFAEWLKFAVLSQIGNTLLVKENP
jgi:hypothetical protein